MGVTRKPVVVFGTTVLSKLAKHCLEHDNGREVAALTLDGAYLTTDSYLGVPVVAFETLEERFSAADVEMLIPLGYRGMHALRIDKCLQAKRKGFTLTHCVSRHALVAPDCEVRDNGLIYEFASIQTDVTMGWDVRVGAGAIIGHDCVIGDHTYLAARSVIGGSTVVGERCWIGLGAVVRNDVRIADRTFVAAGAVVVGDTESDLVYAGNPARPMPGKSALEVTSRQSGSD